MSESDDRFPFTAMFRSGHTDTSERMSDGFELRRRHMIPATGDYVVTFADGQDRWPVEAWDDDGAPMIVCSRGLIRVADASGGVEWTIEQRRDRRVNGPPRTA